MTATTGNGRHLRFRELAATALDFPLSPAEAAELEAHLATCPDCARLAGGLRFDAAALRRPVELATSYRLDSAVGAAIAGRPPRPSPGRTLLLVAATALLLVGLLGAVAVGAYLWRTLQPPLLVVDPSPAPSGLPLPSGEPVPTAKPGPAVPALTWELGQIPPMVDGAESHPTAVSHGYGVFVAVGGRVFRDNETPSGGIASAWRSEDGLAWEPATGDGLAMGDGVFVDDYPAPGLVDVAWGRPGVVAVGTSRMTDREGGAWFSPDGMTWTRADFPDAARARPAAVTWTGTKFVAVGVVEEEGTPRGAAWASDDGRSWERAPDSDAFDIGGYITLPSGYGTGGPVDVAYVTWDGTILATGSTCAATADMEERTTCRPLVLTSRIGATWEREDVPGEARLGSVAATGDRVVALAGTGESGSTLVMVRDEGGWRLVDLPSVPDLARVISYGDGFLALSIAGDEVALYWSADGETWSRLPGVPQPSDVDVLRTEVDLSNVLGTVVVVGSAESESGSGPGGFTIVGTPLAAPEASPSPTATPADGRGLEAGELRVVSVGASGVPVTALGERPPALDGDGTVIAFEHGSPGSGSMVLVHDLSTATTVVGSVASDGTAAGDTAWRPSLSADGRYLAFDSWSADLVPGDTNKGQDVFVRDLVAGTTVRVSVSSDGSQAATGGWLAAISSDGSTVAFAATSPDLVAGDTNKRSDIFVHDLVTGETARVSVGPGGRQANGDSTQPAVSADGSVIAFYSAATNLVRGDTNEVLDLFVHDRATGETTRVSVASDGTQGNGHAGPATSCVTGSDGWTQCSAGEPPALSGDGQLVVFASDATNLFPGDRNAVADVFLHDRFTGETTLLSRRPDGTQADGMSYEPVISADGSVVAFTTGATNLEARDTNGEGDVFIVELATGNLVRVSTDSSGNAVGGSQPALSRDGRVVAFLTTVTDLVPRAASPGIVATLVAALDR